MSTQSTDARREFIHYVLDHSANPASCLGAVIVYLRKGDPYQVRVAAAASRAIEKELDAIHAERELHGLRR